MTAKNKVDQPQTSGAMIIDVVTCFERKLCKKNAMVCYVWTSKHGCFSCFQSEWEKFNMPQPITGHVVAISYKKEGRYANIVDIKDVNSYLQRTTSKACR